MTPAEKIQKIKEIEQKFVAEIERIQKEFQAKIREAMAVADKERIESLKKDLGM